MLQKISTQVMPICQLHRKTRSTSLATRAHIGGGLVEDKYAGPLQQRASHAQQLSLAGAEVCSALNEHSIKTALTGSN